MFRKADAEQAKSTGGMLALVPSAATATRLVVNDPKAEPIEELHLTLAYFGQDVRGLYSSVSAEMLMRDVAEAFPPIQAKAMGHALFNPSGDEPCAVYLIGDNDYLPELYHTVQDLLHTSYDMPRQHTPFIPHVTGGYDLPISKLGYDGPVTFDLITLKWAGESYIAPLSGVI